MYTLLDALKKCNYRRIDCKDVSILNLEISVSPESKEYLESIGVKVQEDMRIGDSRHSLFTTAMQAEFLPNANIKLCENDMSGFIEWSNGNYNIVGLSISDFNVGFEAQKEMASKSYMSASVGNSGNMSGYPDTDKWFDLVGACDMNNIMRSYSSNGLTDVNYVGIDGYTFLGTDIYGTSYSRPFTVILESIATQEFYNKHGFHWTPMQMSKFVKRNCIDIDDEGYDIKSGAGLFVLPPEDQMNFFNSVEITDELLNCVRVVGNNDTIFITDYGVDFSENSNNVANLIAYIARRKMSDNNIELDRIVFDVGSVEKYLLRDLISNSSMFIDKLERGEA